MPLKNLPIQPSLTPMGISGTNNVTIAPNLNPVPKERKKSSSSGIVIRTSKHWVLPPRPKPGRKPSVSTAGSRSSSVAISSSSVNTSKATTPGVSLAPSSVSSRASTPPTKHETRNDEEKIRNSSRRAASETAAIVATTTRSASSIPLARPPAVPVCKLAGTQMTAKLASRNSDTSPSEDSLDSTDVCSARKGKPTTKTKKTSAKKPTKTVLKKEIQQLKLQNYKLKQELGQLVGNLQELKQRYSLSKATISQVSTCAPVTSVRKRSFIDVGEGSETDNTDAFLKFEDEDDNGQTPFIANVAMKQTLSFSSQYSSRTNLTDEEDTGFSSSTPSSLFSAELQRSMTNSSYANNGSSTHHSNHQNNSGALAHSPHNQLNSPVSTVSSRPPSASVDAMVFLDDYEQMEFYSKHRQLLDPEKQKVNLEHHDQPNVNTSGSTSSTSAPPNSSQPTELHLDVIKEEDLDFKFDHDFEGDDLSILNFLESHISDNKSGTTAVTEQAPSWLMEEDPTVPANLFNDGETDCDLQKSDFYMPPSLEELMEEQDVAPTEKLLDNEIRNEDHDDMLRLDAFEFA